MVISWSYTNLNPYIKGFLYSYRVKFSFRSFDQLEIAGAKRMEGAPNDRWEKCLAQGFARQKKAG